jgi:Uma2 family endonuclease
VESPSNTAYEFERRETVCLRSGCKEFWIVYPKSRIVRVATQGQVRRYGVGDVIALSLVDGVSIAVADIFTDAGPSDRRRD